MPGLQAWDGAGNLIVDLGDFSTRFVHRQQIVFPRSTAIVSFAVGGINGYNSFACIKNANIYIGSAYACVTRENAVDVIYLPTSNPFSDVTMDIEIYKFN